MVFFLMIRRPPRATRTDTLFPYTTLFRSRLGAANHDIYFGDRNVERSWIAGIERASANTGVKPSSEVLRLFFASSRYRHRNIGCGMEMRDHVPPDRPIATNDEDVFHRLTRPIRAISRPAHNAGSIWRMPVATSE